MTILELNKIRQLARSCRLFALLQQLRESAIELELRKSSQRAKELSDSRTLLAATLSRFEKHRFIEVHADTRPSVPVSSEFLEDLNRRVIEREAECEIAMFSFRSICDRLNVLRRRRALAEQIVQTCRRKLLGVEREMKDALYFYG